MARPLLIVDAPSLLYRAFYALPKTITDAKGRSVNALLGTTNLLLREVEKHDPRAVVLCFGPDAARYRKDLYEPYHAERPPVPDELAPQFADAPELVPDFIALRGDPSDGIPGAKGVGEKTAADLLRRHGSLEAAIENAVRERPPRLSGALLNGADELRMFKDLATLRAEKVKRPRDRKLDLAGGAAAARERGMNRLAERLEKAASATG